MPGSKAKIQNGPLCGVTFESRLTMILRNIAGYGGVVAEPQAYAAARREFCSVSGCSITVAIQVRGINRAR